MTTTSTRSASFLGVGIGLRPQHQTELLAAGDLASGGIDFLEAIAENFMVPGGRPPRVLAALRERVPLVLHGVSLNIGSADALDATHLDALAELTNRFAPAWFSDHLCWTGVAGRSLHDLLPLPLTESSLAHVVARVARVQERLGRRIALENVSSYLAYRDDALPEETFLAEVARRADCGILLDVNNVYVSAANHGFDAREYLARIPVDRVRQVHLAGHTVASTHLIDTHDAPVCDGVWQLYADACTRFGPVATMIERDAAIPPLDELLTELERARAIARLGMAVAA